MIDPLPETVVCHGCGEEVDRNEDLSVSRDGCYVATYECDCGAEGSIRFDPAAAAVTACEGAVFGPPEEQLVADGRGGDQW